MREITLEESKAIQLEILSAIHAFCVERKIKYYLAYGTLLGAIRHQGYIPWDDDIDIMMFRQDYDYFIKYFNESSERYRVISPEINLDYYVSYANVYDVRTLMEEPHVFHRVDIGVKIDVFPLDSTPDAFSSYKRLKDTLMIYTRLKYGKVTNLKNASLRRRIGFILAIPIPFRWMQKRVLAIINKHRNNDSYYVDVMICPSYGYKRLERSLFDSTIDVRFENMSFWAPRGYDIVLQTIYGDYMQLPPIEERTPKHSFVAHWK